MFKVFSLTVLLFIIFSFSCAKPSRNNLKRSSINQTPQFQNYNFESNLNFSAFFDDLGAPTGNKVMLRGVGENSTYKATYKFNSGPSTFLEIVAISVTSPTHVYPHIKKMTLLDGKAAVDYLPDQINLQLNPNTDYKFEVVFASDSNYKKMEFSIDLVVWKGAGNDTPVMGLICGENNSTLIRLNRSANAADIVHHGESYLGMYRFCGEKFENLKSSQSQHLYFNPLQNNITESGFYSASSSAETRSARIEYIPKLGQVNVQCYHNELPTVLSGFGPCRPTLLDRRFAQ